LLASQKSSRGDRLLAPLASVTSARNQPQEIAELLRRSAELSGANAAAIRMKILTGLAEGLARNRTRPPIPAEGQKALERLLKNAAIEEKPLVLRVATLVKLKDSEAIRAARAEAIRTPLDGGRAAAERLAALNLLAGASAEELKPLQELLG